MDLYTQAENKVKSSAALNKHYDFIMADWHEGDEHWQWVIDASVEEIVDWVEAA